MCDDHIKPGSLRDHWSSCSLFNLPAAWPMSCDCGGFTKHTPPEGAFSRLGYNLAVAGRRWLVLWQMRIAWKDEDRASLIRFALTFATHLALGRRAGRNTVHAVQRFFESLCKNS